MPSDECQVTRNGLLVTRHWPLITVLSGGPENRTLPCTLVRGNYRLIRPARTPVLTTLEARLGIEPRLSALQADAFPLGYRALAGAVGIGPTPAVLETAALSLRHAPVLKGLAVVKEQ